MEKAIGLGWLAISFLTLATLHAGPAMAQIQDAPIAVVTVPPPDWTPTPSAELARQPSDVEMRRAYPRAARRARTDAMVVLHCTVNIDQSLACPRVSVSDFFGGPLSVTEETREAFASAGRKIQQGLRALPVLSNGEPSIGRPLMVVLYFRHDR